MAFKLKDTVPPEMAKHVAEVLHVVCDGKEWKVLSRVPVKENNG